ncbi:MAG: hypothetical protein CMG74_04935 [Candidatus Marinimicrobia bacterium]|nr:hypothetical protein [Candidatus Neomarinimicrobiota bacterium]|tara:strand:+ start:8141 stop:9064 length:924 start_codon:yes stop_codon:yes gene_type:complete
MNILILGGTGFIGSKILKKIQVKFKVENLSLSEGFDLRKENIIKNFIKKKKFHTIINCAAHVGGLGYIKERKAEIISDNIKIYLNLYSSLKNLKKKPNIINLISNCVYPGKLKLQSESKVFDGQIHDSVEPFGLAKLVLLKLAKFFYDQYSIKTLNLILPNAYGPGDHVDTRRSHALNGIIVRMINRQRKKEKYFEIWGSGKPKREWIYADDVSKLIFMILNDKNIFKNCENLNVAQNKSYSINYIAKKVKKILNYNCKLYNNLKFPDGASMKQLDNKIFNKKFKNFIFTDFSKGLKKTINFYKNTI